MPVFGEAQDAVVTTSLLLLGDTKAGKTYWMMQAAEAGFNVLYIDGDVAAPTLAQLSPAAKQRIFYLPVHDYTNDNGDYINNFAEFFVAFTTTGKFLWNDSLCRQFNLKDYKPEEGHVVWEIRPSQLGPDTVVIIDSWTTLTQSLITWKADDLGVDLMEIEKFGREMYTGAGHKATQFLKLLRALPCHLGVIGHPREYVKRSAPKGSKGLVPEKDMKVDWIQMVPVSTSNPHALTLGANFSAIGWIDVSPTGNRTIDFKPSDSRVIGGPINTNKPVAEFAYKDFILACGGHVPTGASADSWLTRYGPGEYAPPGKANPLGVKPALVSPSPVVELSPPADAPRKVQGLGGLARLKPKGVMK
jgi:hypothetical protein